MELAEETVSRILHRSLDHTFGFCDIGSPPAVLDMLDDFRRELFLKLEPMAVARFSIIWTSSSGEKSLM